MACEGCQRRRAAMKHAAHNISQKAVKRIKRVKRVVVKAKGE